jgi:uncharacterized protein (DUF2141 family)
MVLIVASTGLLAGRIQAEPEAGTTLTVHLSGFRNANGKAAVSLFAKADGFPESAQKSLRRTWTDIDKGHASVTFSNLKPGRYAVAALHDENGNQKMDKNFLGMPTEGYGVSNNVHSTFSAPSFKDAAFQLAVAGGTIQIKIGY